LTLSSGSSKRKTIATQSPEFGVAIMGGLDAGEKLMGRMGAVEFIIPLICFSFIAAYAVNWVKLEAADAKA
jgi:hypothetical protein